MLYRVTLYQITRKGNNWNKKETARVFLTEFSRPASIDEAGWQVMRQTNKPADWFQCEELITFFDWRDQKEKTKWSFVISGTI